MTTTRVSSSDIFPAKSVEAQTPTRFTATGIPTVSVAGTTLAAQQEEKMMQVKEQN
jgi:hypothetical protein